MTTYIKICLLEAIISLLYLQKTKGNDCPDTINGYTKHSRQVCNSE